jgi:hypothetical protein
MAVQYSSDIQQQQQPGPVTLSSTSGNKTSGQILPTGGNPNSTSGKVIRTLPAYPYPLVPKFTGNGDVNSGSNYVSVLSTAVSQDDFKWLGQGLFAHQSNQLEKDVVAQNEHIKSVTAITEVFGDGQKTSAAAVEYDKDINNSKLTISDFSVSGRTITKVYANNAPAKTSQGTSGKYVIIELSPNDANASTFIKYMGPPPANNNNASSITPPPPVANPITMKEVKVSVTQVGDIKTTDGLTYASNYRPIAIIEP